MAREEETAKLERPLRPAQGQAAGEHRAGAVALSVFASSLNAQILRALGERPMRFTELREAAGCPAQTTLRNRLRQLIWMGAIEKRQVRALPYGVAHQLTDLGADLLHLAGLLDSWLAASPGGPRSLDGEAGRAAVKAFASGWSSTVFRVLSSESLCLTHLSRLIRHTSYPALERQLSNLRIAGHVEPVSGDGSCNPYAVTEWSRRGVLPLRAARHAGRGSRAAGRQGGGEGGPGCLLRLQARRGAAQLGARLGGGMARHRGGGHPRPAGDRRRRAGASAPPPPRRLQPPARLIGHIAGADSAHSPQR